MNNEKTPIEKVTELLQAIKKCEIAKDLAYQLDQLLPSSLSKTQTELTDLYIQYGILPDDSKADSQGWIKADVIRQAKDSLFKQQEQQLKLQILEVLGFTKKLTPESSIN